MKDRMQDRSGAPSSKSERADENPPGTQANGVVEVGETEKTDFKSRHGGDRTQLPVNVFKKGQRAEGSFSAVPVEIKRP